jgi:hypothetical protein
VAARSSGDPPKYRGSVSTEIAAAPPLANAEAWDGGDSALLISPREGDLRLISATTATSAR